MLWTGVRVVETRDDSGKVVSDRVKAEIVDSPLGDDHDVDRPGEELWLGTKGLTHPPLDTVSVNGAADFS